MYNAAKEEYVYAIAGGETIQIIDYLERAAKQAKKDLISYADTQGISVTRIAGANNANIDYELKDPDAPVPAGWEMNDSRAGLHLMPNYDFDSEDGRKVCRELSAFQSVLNIQQQFDDLCHSLAPSSHLNNRKYSYEKIGDDIIVSCPKQYEGDAIIPTGSTVISWLDYVSLQEKANPTPAAQTRVFQNKFSPNG